MKKLIFILAIYLISQNVNAQAFSVGNTCCNYNLVNKTFSPFCNPPTIWTSLDSFQIDITGDLLPDIVVKSQCILNSSASGASDNCIFITSPNNVESVIALTFTNTLIIDNLLFGSGYSASLNWDTLPSNVPFSSTGPSAAWEPVVYEWWHRTMLSVTVISGTQTNPFYVGFRKILPSTDTIYGWIKMDSNFPGKVVDYAYTCGSYTSTPLASTVQTLPSSIQKCDSVMLNAIPAGGMFYGPGVSGNYFKSKNLMPGTYTVNYVLPNPTGCNVQASSVTFTINGASITSTQTALCVGESLTLSATPPGGVYSGTYVSSNGYFSPTSSGTQQAVYNYTNATGCNLTATLQVTANPCVGINELIKDDDIFKIFPNPNLGEFEIKSSKETSIVITNELGQLVKTLQLNSINNYTSKVTELQSGIYFVGNNSIRRKIVVIK